MSRESETALSNFKRCAEESPAGTYEDVKRLNEVVGDACDDLIKDIRALGLKADTCDLIFAVEAAIYDYVKKSNPDASFFHVAEGFGEAMDGPARDRVLAQAEANRDFFRNIAAESTGH